METANYRYAKEFDKKIHKYPNPFNLDKMNSSQSARQKLGKADKINTSYYSLVNMGTEQPSARYDDRGLELTEIEKLDSSINKLLDRNEKIAQTIVANLENLQNDNDLKDVVEHSNKKLNEERINN